MPHESSIHIIEQFMASAKEVMATVEVIHTNPELLRDAILTASEGDAILLAQPNDLSAELFSAIRGNVNVVTNPAKEQISTIRTGVTDAFCGIASTGSVCISVSDNLSGPVSMLSRRHIVVVDSKTIIPRPRNLFSNDYLDGKGLQRSFSIITGPSATADMGPLVRGVHGPGKLHIIILE